MITIRRLSWRGLLTLLTLILAGAPDAWPARAADATVEIVDVDTDDLFAFRPSSTTVGLNGAVQWTNRSIAAHNVTFRDGPASSTLNTGDSYSRTFSTPGAYDYFCAFHPSMTGTVTVLEQPLIPRVWIPLIINDSTGAPTGVE